MIAQLHSSYVETSTHPIVNSDIISILATSHVAGTPWHCTFNARTLVGVAISSHYRILHQLVGDGAAQLLGICHQPLHLAAVGDGPKHFGPLMVQSAHHDMDPLTKGKFGGLRSVFATELSSFSQCRVSQVRQGQGKTRLTIEVISVYRSCPYDPSHFFTRCFNHIRSFTWKHLMSCNNHNIKCRKVTSEFRPCVLSLASLLFLS